MVGRTTFLVYHIFHEAEGRPTSPLIIFQSRTCLAGAVGAPHPLDWPQSICAHTHPLLPRVRPVNPVGGRGGEGGRLLGVKKDVVGVASGEIGTHARPRYTTVLYSM